MVPIPTPVYHITHVENFRKIVRRGLLLAKSLVGQEDQQYVDIAHQNIQDRRARVLVPCGPCGCLHEYVPFYFGRRSPMLYSISRGNVEGYSEGQVPIIYCISTAQAIADAGIGFVFTDGHGIMTFTEFYADLADLDEVDWPLMEARYWYDTVDDLDRKRRRQAEFLIYQSLPLEFIHEVATYNRETKEAVERILSNSNYRPLVTVQRSWYY